MIKVIAGLVLGLFIGAACRWFDIPLPGPPKLVGALLVVSITVGYTAADKLMTVRLSETRPALTRELCGGPTGEVMARRIPVKLTDSE